MRGPNKSALLATFAVLLIFVLPALFIAFAAGVELIKVARYLGDRSTQEGGAVAYLTHKQQSASLSVVTNHRRSPLLHQAAS